MAEQIPRMRLGMQTPEAVDFGDVDEPVKIDAGDRAYGLRGAEPQRVRVL